MSLYDRFNLAEACLWLAVAIVIAVRTPTTSRQQQAGVILAIVGFIAFGVTDLLEVGRAGHLPLWIWSCKITCGTTILIARYTWLGWNRFRWTDRDCVFGFCCLVAVAFIIVLERLLDS